MTAPPNPSPPPSASRGFGWRRVLVVFAKEVQDHLRDKRSLVLALLYPVAGPLLIAALLLVSSGGLGTPESGVRLAGIRGADNAPDLSGFLARRGFAMVPADRDGAQMVRNGRLPALLEVVAPPPGSDQLAVRILSDSTRLPNLAVAVALAEAVQAYGREKARLRLAAAGLDPDLAEPVTLEQINLGRRPDLAGFVHALIPPLALFIIFLGAVYLSIDTTVGERERGSWEPLLTAPVRRSELLLGKAAAAFLFTAAALAFLLASFHGSLALVGVLRPGLAPPPEIATLVLLFLLALPLMGLAVILQITVAAVSRSMKEAQIYLGLLPLLPAVPGMLVAFSPVEPAPALAAIPAVGQVLLFARLIEGEPVALVPMLMATATTLALAVGLFLLAARLFDRQSLSVQG